MALHLGKYVAYGELYNTRRNSVHGWLGLMGMDCTVCFELSGNCEPDLVGKHIRFKAPQLPRATFDEGSVDHFQIRQIGPPGKITAALKLRVDALGNPVPPDAAADTAGEWRPCLHIEWFGQNGRVVVEMIAPIIQVVEADNEPDADAFFGALLPDLPEVKQARAAFPEPFSIDPEAGFDADIEAGDESGGLFSTLPSDELQRHLDRRNRDIDRAVFGQDDISADIREVELMDDLIESGVGESLESILEGSAPLPDPDSLNENQAELVLRVLLARLALSGIAVDMCEHVTALDTYRLFRERISPDARCHRELKGTGWVQHVSIYEYCDECEAEFEREWEARDQSEMTEDGEPCDEQ